MYWCIGTCLTGSFGGWIMKKIIFVFCICFISQVASAACFTKEQAVWANCKIDAPKYYQCLLIYGDQNRKFYNNCEYAEIEKKQSELDEVTRKMSGTINSLLFATEKGKEYMAYQEMINEAVTRKSCPPSCD